MHHVKLKKKKNNTVYSIQYTVYTTFGAPCHIKSNG